MSTVERTEEILGKAEQSLVQLANELASNREYEVAAALINMAKEISRLPNRLQALLGDHPPYTGPSLQIDTVPSANTEPPLPAPTPTRLGEPKARRYPRFLREGENLVKIAWSKAEKSEYEHKCPRPVLLSLVTALEKAGLSGKRFAMDKVIPFLKQDGVPPYQAYLCLAWLRQIGAVVQHGRKGYSLKAGDGLATAVENGWAQLTTR